MKHTLFCIICTQFLHILQKVDLMQRTDKTGTTEVIRIPISLCHIFPKRVRGAALKHFKTRAYSKWEEVGEVYLCLTLKGKCAKRARGCVWSHWLLVALKVTQDKQEEGRSWNTKVITHNRMSIQHGVLKAVYRTEPGDTESWVKAPAASHVTWESFPQPQGVSSPIK